MFPTILYTHIENYCWQCKPNTSCSRQLRKCAFSKQKRDYPSPAIDFCKPFYKLCTKHAVWHDNIKLHAGIAAVGGFISYAVKSAGCCVEQKLIIDNLSPVFVSSVSNAFQCYERNSGWFKNCVQH